MRKICRMGTAALFTLVILSGQAETTESRFYLSDAQRPIYTVYETGTSSPIGLVRHDARGIAIFDLTCGDESFQTFSLEFLSGLYSGRVGTSQSAKLPDAKESISSSPLVISNQSADQVEKLRSLVEEYGAGPAIRQMALKTVSLYAENYPETTGLVTIAAFGTLNGPEGFDGVLVHPRVMAEGIKKADYFSSATSSELIAPGAASTSFPERLGVLLGLDVSAPVGDIDYGGYSIVDYYLLTDFEREYAKEQIEKGDAKYGILLSQFYASQAMIDKKRQSELLTKSRKWLETAANLGYPPALYNAAYLGISDGIYPMKQSEAWLEKLKELEKDQTTSSLKSNIKALELDLAEKRKLKKANPL